MSLPKVSPQPYTHYAHEGLLFSKKYKKEIEYAHQVFVAFFQEGADIGKIEVLRKAAVEAGLDGESFERALRSREFSEEREKILRQNVDEATITAVPTICIGERVLKGLQPKDNIEHALNGAIRDGKTEFCEGDECG
jgi:predicted DsbA family dithiol-disulfide isomerase